MRKINVRMFKQFFGSIPSLRPERVTEHSPTRDASLRNEKYPPPYGAQYRQDALWEGE
jgi:hypothetical protein